MTEGPELVFIINDQRMLGESGATFDAVTPADRSVVATVNNDGVPEVERAVAVAAAFREWSVTRAEASRSLPGGDPRLRGVRHRPRGGHEAARSARR